MSDRYFFDKSVCMTCSTCIWQGAQLGSDCCFTWNLCKISRYDVRGIFWGDKGEGGIQNVETYGIEVPTKTAGLYLVPRQRNLIFWDFGDFGSFLGVLGVFQGNFWGIKGLGSIQNKGNKWVWGPCENPRSLSTPKAEKFDFFIFLTIRMVFLWLICKK